MLKWLKSSRKQDAVDQDTPIKLSSEAEVDLIVRLLEKKFNHKFQKRVKVDGYIGENFEYKLVVDDYCDPSGTIDDHHSIYGRSTEDVLEVNKSFLKAYWDTVVERAVNTKSDENLTDFDRELIEDYKKVVVAESREQLLMLADLEGLS